MLEDSPFSAAIVEASEERVWDGEGTKAEKEKQEDDETRHPCLRTMRVLELLTIERARNARRRENDGGESEGEKRERDERKQYL